MEVNIEDERFLKDLAIFSKNINDFVSKKILKKGSKIINKYKKFYYIKFN